MKILQYKESATRPRMDFAAILIISLASLPNASAQTQNLTAFVNVNVIPMDSERVMSRYTVVVEGEEITAVGPTGDIELPSGAEVIDGDGAYLIPGLADMHAHLNVDPNPDFMRLFLAEGVTTLRNLNALPEHLKWRDQVVRGERIGPTIYSSGPVIVGPPEPTMIWIFSLLVFVVPLALGTTLWTLLWLLHRLRGSDRDNTPLRRVALPGAIVMVAIGAVLFFTKAIPLNAYASLQYPFAYFPDTEARARAEVRRQVNAGYHLIKVYDWMTRDQYLGVIDEARMQGIYVIGHLDYGIEAPLAAGLRESAHVDEFLDEHLMGEITPQAFHPVPVDTDLIPQSVESVVEYDALVVSNMATDVITYEYLEEGPGYFARPEYSRIRPQTIRTWLSGRMVNWQGQQEWRRDTLQPFYEQMTWTLHAAGVPILTGTDTGVDGSLPEHIHRELELLVEAGLSPFEALRAATSNARLSVNRMGVADAFGEVAVGQRADLVLLESNPMENVSATRQRLGVMSRGRWYSQDELDRLIAELIASYE